MRNVQVWKRKGEDFYFKAEYKPEWVKGTDSLTKVYQLVWVRDPNEATPYCEIPRYWMNHITARNYEKVWV